VILRSLLFVPADSERKLEKAKSSRADALILDLEDSVAGENRPAARILMRNFVKAAPAAWVRINPVGSADYRDDLEAVVAARPAGVMVPKPDSPDALRVLDDDLSRLERMRGLPERDILVIPVASETPEAVLALHQYGNKPPPRLRAITWGAEDLSAALGASTNRDENGEFAFTYRLARSFCLLAAKAARVEAIETLHADFRDLAGLARMARNARREGFSGMLAIHPAQVEVINATFTPSHEDVAQARRVVEAFAGGAGVASLDGKMLDRPHLKQAEHVLALDDALRTRA